MPSDRPTGDRVSFPETAWTHVLAGRFGDETATARAFEELCRQYWPAIFSYLRALGLTKEEAEDATQEFVAEFLLGEPLLRADPERGRLRAYMKQSLRHFLSNRTRAANRLKRGGKLEHLELESTDPSPGLATDAPPDETYDREWAWTVMERAMISLKENYAARGKGAVFDLIKPALAGADTLTSYALLGQSAGMSEAQIKLEVHRARRRLGDRLRREVAATVASEADVETEMRYLLTVLARQ